VTITNTTNEASSTERKRFPLPVQLLLERGDSSMERGEYDNALADYSDALECCLTDSSIPPHSTNYVQVQLRHAQDSLRWTLTSGGDPNHHLIPDEAREIVRNASLPSGHLLTVDSEVILGQYPLTPEGCQEATREAELTAFEIKERKHLRNLASRDDFDFVIYACDDGQITQVCRTEALPWPARFEGTLDGLLVIFRQLHAPVPWCWRPGLRWQAEAHVRSDERYHALGVCWMCDPESVKAPGKCRVGYGPSVDYLFVLDGWRRNGIATGFINACRKRWPGLKLGSGATDEGVAFLNAYSEAHPEDKSENEAGVPEIKAAAAQTTETGSQRPASIPG
jgi:GNAT superfamily N-acetyltransferase